MGDAVRRSGPQRAPEAGADKGAGSPPREAFSVLVPLHEFVHSITGARVYSTKEALDSPGYQKSPAPICLVWENTIRFDPRRVAEK